MTQIELTSGGAYLVPNFVALDLVRELGSQVLRVTVMGPGDMQQQPKDWTKNA